MTSGRQFLIGHTLFVLETFYASELVGKTTFCASFIIIQQEHFYYDLRQGKTSWMSFGVGFSRNIRFEINFAKNKTYEIFPLLISRNTHQLCVLFQFRQSLNLKHVYVKPQGGVVGNYYLQAHIEPNPEYQGVGIQPLSSWQKPVRTRYFWGV